MLTDSSSEISPAKSPAKSFSPLFIFTWILALLLGIGLALSWMPSVFVDGEVHPVGNDGFYHATRILAVAEDLTSTHAFDQNLHWPEGHWITWPWAYDYLGGLATKILSNDRASAARIMVFYPIFWLIANITLIGLIAKENLKPRLAAVSVIAFAIAPVTLSLHSLGKLDHHSAELFWLLMSMYVTSLWLKFPESSRIPIALGAILATATAFHNSLFLLQIPVLVILFVTRLSDASIATRRKNNLFGASLLITQILVLLPSHQFLTFEYEFYYHSWFHLHISLLSAMTAYALGKKQILSMSFILFVTLLFGLLAVGQVLYGLSYIQADEFVLNTMLETRSPFGENLPISEMNQYYSGLIWLLPFCLGYITYKVITERLHVSSLLFMVYGFFGLALLAGQIRFVNFGYAFLILIPILVIQQLLPRGRDVFIACALFFWAYTYSFSNYLIPPMLGHSQRYDIGLPLILKARSQCEQKPGLLLAENNWGNFFRYQTICPLIANNFLITRKELEYVRLSADLMGQTPERLRELAPQVRYVFVSRTEDNLLGQKLLSNEEFDGFEKIGEVSKDNGEVFARLFSVE
jgi:hypothetical protein